MRRGRFTPPYFLIRPKTRAKYLMNWVAVHQNMDSLAIRYFDHEHVWLHFVVHLIFVVSPAILVVLLFSFLLRAIKALYRRKKQLEEEDEHEISMMPKSVLAFVLKFTGRKQIFLGLGAALTIPITYAGLELPKQIINKALSIEDVLSTSSNSNEAQVALLLYLCGLYLVVLILGGLLKFLLNFYKGKLSETLIRRLRLYILKKRTIDPLEADKTRLVPVIVQEVEPVCGFSGDSFIVPLLQGGTAVTIIIFMLVQDIALGAAAIALLPVQLVVIPRFQKRINKLVHQRVGVVRSLSSVLQNNAHEERNQIRRQAIELISQLQEMRFKLFRVKYLSKAINNFIMNLTPFFFYTIGGYLVIEGNLSIGALVASLASYKDLAPAIRELFAYYQSYQDARVRYSEIYVYAR